MKHLITGGYGDVGSMLYKLYRAENMDICHFGEERNEDADRILHLAAKSPPATSDQIINSNIYYLQEIGKYAVEHGIEEMIFFSGIAVYGKQNREDLSETDAIVESDVYATSKLMGEKILHDFPLKVLCVRLPGILGFRNTTNFLSRCYMSLKHNEPLAIANPGRISNNFISVESIFAFLSDFRFTRKYDVINLASKKGITVLEIVTLMKDVMKSGSEIVINNEEQPFFNISTDKAESEYGFRPRDPGDVITGWVRQRQEYERHTVSKAEG